MYENLDLVCSLDEISIIEKSGDKMRMMGFASTASLDSDKETIIQEGINFKPFLEKGFVNFEHKREDIIGIPTHAELKQHPEKDVKGLYVEFELLKGIEKAENVWKLAQALEKSQSSRRLGLSIEGKKRKVGKGGKILKADMYGLAVTSRPKNSDTSASILMKGMIDDEQSIDYSVFDNSSSDELIEHVSSAIIEKIQKAMSTGYDIGGTSQTGGGAIRAENIDKKGDTIYVPVSVASLTDIDMDDDGKYMMGILKGCAERRNGKLTKGEAAVMLQLYGIGLKDSIQKIREKF